jgi:hypothetical protein
MLNLTQEEKRDRHLNQIRKWNAEKKLARKIIQRRYYEKNNTDKIQSKKNKEVEKEFANLRKIMW